MATVWLIFLCSLKLTLGQFVEQHLIEFDQILTTDQLRPQNFVVRTGSRWVSYVSYHATPLFVTTISPGHIP